MRMGAPFETCLAPDGFNFFATVANAADINKRVLFARDAAGTIQGRCLLALDDEGRIVTFHVYAHADGAAMTAAVRGFVERLAAAMGTSVMARGEIRPLVATDWYDDGPRDLVGQLAFLEEGSPFMAALARIAPADLVGRIEAEIGIHPLPASIAYSVARLDQLHSRPELIVPLMPHLGAIDRLDPWTRTMLAPLLRRAGEPGLALRVLEPMLAKAVASRIANGWTEADAARELVLLGAPHRALRLLRQTRPSHAGDWKDDSNERLIVAADALMALGRPRRALELARIVATRGDQAGRILVAELEAELSGLVIPAST
jgi:hypothetical protein